MSSWETSGESYCNDRSKEFSKNRNILKSIQSILRRKIAKGEVKAPCDATVSTIFDTKHAIGLATESGLELLIHIGVDTVELGGKFYTAHVKDGDVVKKGQTLITFDMDAIKATGYDVTTPLIVTNTDDYEEVKMLAEGTVNNGSEVLEVK